MRSRVYRSVRVARRAVLTALVLTALVLAAPGTVRAAPTWHVETLDRPVAGLVLSNTSVAYGDQLHVFTGIVTERMAGVRHEWWDGTRWHVENLIGPDNQFASVPVVTVFNGQLHAFMGTSGNYGPSHVKHVWWDGTQWHAEILDGVGSAWPGHHEVASSPSAVIVYNGQLHLLAGGGIGPLP